MKKVIISILTALSLCVSSRVSAGPEDLVISDRQVISYGAEADASAPLGFYAAFPHITRAANGDLVAAYFRGPGHAAQGGGVVVNRSSDGGKTWGNVALDEQTVFRMPNTASLGGAMVTLRSGRIVMMVLTLPPDGRRVSYSLTSDDDGHTWSPGSQLPLIGNYRTTVAGHPVELPTGRLLAPAYWTDIGENRYTCSLWFSDDHGDTWSILTRNGQRVDIARDPSPAGLQYEEPQLGMLDDGRLMALVRTDDPQQIWTTYSSDQGLTWTSLVPAFPGWGWPSWAQLQNGTIIATTRKATPGIGVATPAATSVLRVSYDRGQTWSPETLLQDPSWHIDACMYATVLAETPDRAVVIHAQTWSNQTRTRIEFDRLTLRPSTPQELLGPAILRWWSIDSLMATMPNVSGGDPVQRWPDTMGTPGGDLIVRSDLPRPFWLRFGSYIQTSFQGLPVVGGNSGSAMVQEQLATIPQPTVIYIVMYPYNFQVLTPFYVFDDGNAPGTSLRVVGLTKKMYFSVGGSPVVAYTSPLWPGSGPAVLTIVLNGTRSRIRVNGADIIADAPNAFPSSPLRTFRLGGGGGADVISDVRDVVISSAIDDATIVQVEGMLAARSRL